MANKPKSVPLAWVNEKNALLKKELPKEVQQQPFYPDAYFYSQYYQDHLKGLHYMANAIFSFLKISPNGCTIDFYDEKQFKNVSGDAAGFYTKVKNNSGEENEIILINKKHQDNPLAVGAILAHEMMHLYLFRLNLKIEDVQENELLTDLATINTGLSILILNGMSYSSRWYLTIIMLCLGRIYWSSQSLAFGYFKPKEYGAHAIVYFKEKNISTEDVIDYLNPTSRYFIQRSTFLKGKNSTIFIKVLEKQHRKSNIIKGVIVVPFLALIIYLWVSSSESSAQQSKLSAQTDTCQAAVTILGNQVNTDQTALDNMDTQMTQYQNSDDTSDYNNMVDTYNTLLAKVKGEGSNYETQRADCNNLIDQYNSSIQNN